MKLLVLALVLAVATASMHTGYLNKFEEVLNNNQIQDLSLNQFTNLLKTNFQVLSGVQQGLESFVKGNLLNPVKMNYLFVVEGKDSMLQQLEQTKVQIQKSAEKLLDEVFSTESSESLVRMTNSQYPKESRVPFYYYKSKSVEQESTYEQDFGIKMVRNEGSSNYVLLDQRTNQKVGKAFGLQQCIKENFSGASDYQFKKTGIFKNSDSDMSLIINEQNARDVEALMHDLCAVSKLSNSFTESQSPNFISFVLSYKTIEQNPLVEELINKMIQNAGQNFQKKMGADKVYGQTLIVDELNEIQSQKLLGKVQPRILASANFAALDEGVKATANPTNFGSLIQFWFTIVFIILIFVVALSLFKAEVAKDSLLYAKFITSDGK